MKKKTVYISGPMTGCPNLNKDAFYKAEKHLSEKGFNVINPHSIASILKTKSNPGYKDFLAHDIYALHSCDMIALLPDWNESIGARIEIGFAIACNIPLVDSETLNPLRLNLEFKISNSTNI